MASRGTVCYHCGYVVRKWAVKCPKCRRSMRPPETLGELAARHLKMLEKERK